LLELLVQHPALTDWVGRHLAPQHFADADCRALYAQLRAQPADLNAALAGAGAECQRLAAQIQMAPARMSGTEFAPEQAARDILLRICRNALERRGAELKKQRAQAEGAAREKLTREIAQLTLDSNTLQQGWAQAELVLLALAE
jgi:hypothetical protein